MFDTTITPRWSKQNIEETYQHMKPYFRTDDDLQTMCKSCPHYKGKKHDYEGCKGKMCFTFYLAYQYLEWYNSY